MEEQIDQILLANFREGDWQEARKQLLLLFSVSKRHLVESILDDVKQSHSEYAVEKIKSFLVNCTFGA